LASMAGESGTGACAAAVSAEPSSKHATTLKLNGKSD